MKPPMTWINPPTVAAAASHRAVGIGACDVQAAGTFRITAPLLPSLVAVIVAEPGATAVASPRLETVTTWVLSDAHVTTRPDKVFPSASSAVAVSWSVPPASSVAVAGVTVTAATGIGITVIRAAPLTPWFAAVMVTLPARTAVASPSADTVATLASVDVHVTSSGVSVFPSASMSVTASCSELPSVTTAVDGATMMAATLVLPVVVNRTQSPCDLNPKDLQPSFLHCSLLTGPAATLPAAASDSLKAVRSARAFTLVVESEHATINAASATASRAKRVGTLILVRGWRGLATLGIGDGMARPRSALQELQRTPAAHLRTPATPTRER